MCQEVFKVVQLMDLSQVENRMVLQCAPVITGIKISNLLIILTDDEDKVHAILKKTGIVPYPLLRQKNKTTLLLFRRNELGVYLKQNDVQKFLNEIGYMDLSFGGILQTIQHRYERYRKKGGSFPHELGILLGYPLEDVLGFIEQNGKNYLYSGYWKVYRNVDAKKKLFAQYENAKEELILWLEYGYEIRSLIQMY